MMTDPREALLGVKFPFVDGVAKINAPSGSVMEYSIESVTLSPKCSAAGDAGVILET